MLNIESLEQLTHHLSRLPGVGPKTAQRFVHYILRDKSLSKDLRSSLDRVEQEIVFCSSCYSYTDTEEQVCQLCASELRTNNLICITESPENIAQIESSGIFKGRYHVLHGVISPLEGVSPDDLKISSLLERIDQYLLLHPQSNIEILFALDPDLEGETTMLYIAKLLGQRERVQTSKLAQGVPIGSHLDFVDQRTLSQAIENRIRI